MPVPGAGRDAAPPLRDAMRRHEVLAAGVLSGVAAGAVMMAVAVVAAVARGVPALHPLQIVGESFVGPGALEGVAKVAFAAAVHVLTSAALGLVFAAIIPREFRMAAAMGTGLGFALFSMGVMMSVVAPWANPGLRGQLQIMGGSMVIAHAAFGVTLGIAPSLRRWISREARDAAPGREPARPRGAEIAQKQPTRTT